MPARPSARSPDETEEALRRRIAQLESALATTTSTLTRVTAERDKLRRAYEQLKEHGVDPILTLQPREFPRFPRVVAA